MRFMTTSLGRGSGALLAVACIALTTALPHLAAGQEVEPNEFVPPPDGTNFAIGYYVHGHNEGYNISRGPTISNSGLEVNLGIARYVHYQYLAGLPAGFQIIQVFGSEASGHIGSADLGSTFGAANTNFSVFLYPYANFERKQYLALTAFLYPPIGSYDKASVLNLGSPGWKGDFQLGWDQEIGESFSYDLAFDVAAYGDKTGPFGLRTKTDPDFRLQAWANWNWSRAFQTSLGWESMLGGAGYTNNFLNGSKSEYERIRATASLFVAPNAQVLLEVNHDFVAVGGFKQSFGATARVVYVF